MSKQSAFAALMMPLSLAAVWFGTHVGPGFASGAQLVQYFVGLGWIGVFIGPIAVGVISGIIAYYVLEYSRVRGFRNYRAFYEDFYGKYSVFFANLKDLINLLLSIVVASLTYATGGAILHTVLGMDVTTGGLLTIFLVVVIILCGARLVLMSSSVMTILLVAMIAYVAAISIGPAWSGAMRFVESRAMTVGYPYAIWKMALYIPLFLSFIDTGITMIGDVAKSRRDSVVVAVVGAFLVAGTMLPLMVLFAAGMPEIGKEPLPTLWAMEHVVGVTSGITFLVAAISFLALVSTGVGFLYGVVERYDTILQRRWQSSSQKTRRFLILALIICISLTLGSLGVLNLVNYGYGIVVYANLPCFFIPFLILLPGRLRRLSAK